jgi:hypothetical protein
LGGWDGHSGSDSWMIAQGHLRCGRRSLFVRWRFVHSHPSPSARWMGHPHFAHTCGAPERFVLSHPSQRERWMGKPAFLVRARV